MSRKLQNLVLLLALWVSVGVGWAESFSAPLDTPATMSALAPKRPLIAVTTAGQRIIAVGQRGHIVYSDDGGQSWLQAKVPVSIDLVAVSFATEKKGWAVGHGGVVLHSADGGQTWVRQLTGLQAAKLTVAYWQTQPPSEAMTASLKQAQSLEQEATHGAAPPFLDVLFEDENRGLAVGGFNRIFRTDDGGRSWTPWMDRVDNPQELHLYSIRRAGHQVYMSGEQGMVWRLDARAQRFVQVPTPYRGTLFGTVISSSAVLAFGMNGTIFRSTDEGISWAKVDLGNRAGITAGTVLSGRVLLVNTAGQLWESQNDGLSFSIVQVKSGSFSYFSVANTADGGLALVGSQGVRVVKLP